MERFGDATLGECEGETKREDDGQSSMNMNKVMDMFSDTDTDLDENEPVEREQVQRWKQDRMETQGYRIRSDDDCM